MSGENSKINVPLDVQFNIDPKQIEQMIVDAVLRSTLGELVNKEVNEAIKKLDRYDGPLRNAIAAQVQRIVYDLINTEYAEEIRTAARKHMTEETVNEVTKLAFEALLDKFHTR